MRCAWPPEISATRICAVRRDRLRSWTLPCRLDRSAMQTLTLVSVAVSFPPSESRSFNACVDAGIPLDIEVLRAAATDVNDQLPVLQTAQVRDFLGGIPTMTADGHHVLGPAPRSNRLLFC